MSSSDRKSTSPSSAREEQDGHRKSPTACILDRHLSRSKLTTARSGTVRTCCRHRLKVVGSACSALMARWHRDIYHLRLDPVLQTSHKALRGLTSVKSQTAQRPLFRRSTFSSKPSRCRQPVHMLTDWPARTPTSTHRHGRTSAPSKAAREARAGRASSVKTR